jgi:CBS domain containing-hemolysin-like protein
MQVAFYTFGVLGLAIGLVVFSYLNHIYRELGRVTTGRIHEHLDIFETEIEPKVKMPRRRAALTFALLAHVWLVVVAVLVARGVTVFVPGAWEAVLQHVILLSALVGVAMHLFPYMLLTRSTGRWLLPVLPVIRVFTWLVWPLRAGVELMVSLTELTEEKDTKKEEQDGIEALVEAAEEEGILEREQAQLIEQVVEFGDKRVREVMTPRPEVVAIPASATVEQLRRVLVETKFSRLPVYGESLDDVLGVVFARDILHIPESEAQRRAVRDLIRPALFVPETKRGSQLLKEMQQKRQQMAMVIDEYGSLAGVVTLEDLVEEIVGELGEEDRAPIPEIVREADGALLLRGSVSVEKVQELLGVEFAGAGSATVAGLLNRIAGHVPHSGESFQHEGLRFEVLEANQRKVLRLRVRRVPLPARAAQS